MTESSIKTVHVRIAGRVQGVWYRGWTRDEASRLGLSGWVRNRRDGSVEALFSGEPELVDDMLRRCKMGPSSAIVEHIDVQNSDENLEDQEFRIRSTF